jgi:hypothetical protein
MSPPSKPQRAADNPGWRGGGVPALRELLVRRWVRFGRLIGQRRVSAARNLALSTLADLANFYGPRRGNSVECPCCGWTGAAFRAHSNANAVAYQSACPSCDARSRHRGLLAVLPDVIDRVPEGHWLYVAPERTLMNHLVSKVSRERIVTTDFLSEDVDLPAQDLQRLAIADASFSAVICNHVLEHVPDDGAAMGEIARVLRTGGRAIITVPGDFPDRDTQEWGAPRENGHYRHYGMDIVDKLRRQFSSVEALDMSAVAPARWQVRKHDYVFLVTR